MVLANRLADGRVVFLAADGSWVEDLAGGAMAADADASFLGRRSRIAYPEHRVTIKPFDSTGK
jgi:hypothetical protein